MFRFCVGTDIMRHKPLLMRVKVLYLCPWKNRGAWHHDIESHVEAYIESGILSLPMSDKIEILMTVEYNDLVNKEEGREQALEVMEEQVKYYFSHPGDAVEDATYLITNFGNILDKIREYVPESAGTKSGYSPEQEVFDLLFGQLIEYYEDHVPGFSLPEIS